MPTGRERVDWKAKIDPDFARLAKLYGKFWKASRERNQEEVGRLLRGEFFPLLRTVLRRVQQQGLSLGDSVFRWLSFMKYQTAPEPLFQRMNTGDLKAYDQLAWVYRTYFKWRFGKIDPAKDLRFKTKELHATLLVEGLSSGLGSLTAKELCNFFDANCECGQEHSEEALKRLRWRIREKLRAQSP